MIYKIYSDLKTFKNLNFKEGLNILIADKTPESTEQQTRNRAGKTSLIKIIHFLLGADCKSDSIFKNPDLINYHFGMEFDLDKNKIRIERSGKLPSRILIKEGDINFGHIKLKLDKISGERYISNSEWKVVLSGILFNTEESLKKNKSTRYKPTFRSLISYFIRREYDGAFNSPVKQSNDQQIWDQQIALSFLLDLDWEIPRKWQFVRDKEKGFKELKKAIGEGLFKSFIGTVANLRTQLALSEESTEKLRDQLKTFKVHKQYYEFELTASDITIQINKLSDQNIMDNQIIKELNESLKSEVPPPIDSLNRLYKEAGVILPDIVSRRYEDLVKFHKSVIENRKFYLKQEIESAKNRIDERNREKEENSEKRAKIMEILESHGALDHFHKLHSELSRREVETESIRNKFNSAKQLENESTKLDIERKKLLVELTRDFQERKLNLNKAILAFERFSKSLYEDAGSLTIIESLNGPTYDFQIQGKDSRGINNMQIFCFDLMLTKLIHERKLGPKILVHDSHLFDATDERQASRAIEIGLDVCRDLGIQYIITLNSDQIPSTFSKEFDIKKYIIPQKLTDSKKDGGLFGIRF